MKFFIFKIDVSDSNTFEEIVYVFETIRLVSNNFFPDTDEILGSPPGSTEKNSLSSAPPLSETRLKFIESGSTVYRSRLLGKLTSFSENLLNNSGTVQGPPLSPILVVPAFTPAVTHQAVLIMDPSNIDPPPFLLPRPTCSKTAASKTKSFNYPSSFEAALVSISTTSFHQEKIGGP